MFGVALLLIFVCGDIACGFGIWFVGVVIAELVALILLGWLCVFRVYCVWLCCFSSVVIDLVVILVVGWLWL